MNRMDREPVPLSDELPPDEPAGGLIAALKETTFRSLRHRNYRLYFVGQLVSFTGTWMQSAALMWLLYDRTHDVRWPSYRLVAQVGPTVLLGPFGGSLADRSAKRWLILRTQSAFLANALILTFLIGSGTVLPGDILALQVLNGMVQAIDLPARLSFLPDLVPKEDLINAVGLNSLLFNSARAFGPALTGLLFFVTGLVAPRLFPGSDPVIVGAVCCFSFNSISFVAVLIALSSIHVPTDVHRDRKNEPGSIWDGVRYLTNRAALGGLVLLTLTFCVFAWPTLTLFPGYTREQLGRAESAYSGLVSALGVGALFAALATATFGSASRKGLFLVLGVATTAAGIAGLAAVNVLGAAAVCSAAIGFGLILFLSTGQSTLQLAIPDEKRGRVMAIWAMTLSASAPIGHLLAGQAAEAFGIKSVLMVMAAGTALVAAALAVLVIRRGRATSGTESSPGPIPLPDSECPGAASAPVPPS